MPQSALGVVKIMWDKPNIVLVRNGSGFYGSTKGTGLRL